MKTERLYTLKEMMQCWNEAIDKLIDSRPAYMRFDSFINSLPTASQYTTNKVTDEQIINEAVDICVGNQVTCNYEDLSEFGKYNCDLVIEGIRKGLSLSTQEKQPEREPDGWVLNGEFSVHKPKELMNPIFKPTPVYFENRQQITDWDEVLKHFKSIPYQNRPMLWDWLKQNYTLPKQITEGKEEAIEFAEDEDVQIFIDGVERIKALVKNAKYGNAEQTKKELIEKLNDLI